MIPKDTHPAPGSEALENLESVLVRIRTVCDGEVVRVSDVVDAVGQRSFGPLLLAPSAIVVTPVSGIPGVPTAAAAIIILVALQLLGGRRRVWIPQMLAERRISGRRLGKAIGGCLPVARFLDRLVRPRLAVLTHRPWSGLIALTCIALAATMPPLEALPFMATFTASLILLFSLSITAHDGLLALVAFALTGGVIYGVAGLVT